MRLVFIHQNTPGQFGPLVQHLAATGGHDITMIGTRRDRRIPGVRTVAYSLHRDPSPDTHPYLVRAERAVLYGQAAARVLVALRDRGHRPDLIVAHSGWGEALFVKDVVPRVPLLLYSEFFYHARGADVGFESAQPLGLDVAARTRLRNTHLLHALMACDHAVTATLWQKSLHPALLQPKVSVIHEGVDTAHMAPDPAASVTLDGGVTLRAGEEIVTYVARNLEPYRGFHILMRALPDLLAARPQARVVIVGGDDVSYGGPPPGAPDRTWRAHMLAEVGPERLPPERVIFTGRLPYQTYRRLLQVSAVHVYLTYPFVLSWSMLEAMSCGALVVASDTAPVTEVIEDGVNGLLTSFHDPAALARRVAEALTERDALAPLRAAARRTVVERFERADCLRRQGALLERVAGGTA
ncbi:glycosyltransferase family 4 protein [Roseospira goensis]|uniref:Glycosyltransferase involved in cell wall biosynthesis n=1 Tax=Roseospira goensis TaxID=391922 RepID=A0A7W6S0U2_9PROT|nr:glycosyltransferase family 4 protein [Roseospira goensis]MBB4286627.1 glycosyltransferase involved in cell wall biosynthesis [Roseospira goensis]